MLNSHFNSQRRCRCIKPSSAVASPLDRRVMSAASSASSAASAAVRDVTSGVDGSGISPAGRPVGAGDSHVHPALCSFAPSTGCGRNGMKNCPLRAAPVRACPLAPSPLPLKSGWPHELTGAAVIAQADATESARPVRRDAVAGRGASGGFAVVVSIGGRASQPQGRPPAAVPTGGVALESPANR